MLSYGKRQDTQIRLNSEGPAKALCHGHVTHYACFSELCTDKWNFEKSSIVSAKLKGYAFFSSNKFPSYRHKKSVLDSFPPNGNFLASLTWIICIGPDPTSLDL
jgi:hypothetical protein